jgi:hypothetical protein
MKRVTGTAVQAVGYGYGVETLNGVTCTWSSQTNLNADGSITEEWTRTFTDPAGRTVRTEYAPGTAAGVSAYNGLAPVWWTGGMHETCLLVPPRSKRRLVTKMKPKTRRGGFRQVPQVGVRTNGGFFQTRAVHACGISVAGDDGTR